MKWNSRYLGRIFIFLFCLLLTGCKREVPIISEVNEISYYTQPQAMIIVATERNRYEDVYTDQIWTVPLQDGTSTFEGYLLNQVQTFLRDMRVMNLLAQKQEIEVTEVEIDQLKHLAQLYYSGLSDQDKAYIKCTEEDVYHMYYEYLLSNKVVEQLTVDVDLEVSVNEAKIIQIRQIAADSAAQADEIYQLLQAENADFRDIAAAHSTNQTIERQLARGEEAEAYEQQAFALHTGEISEVFEVNGSYYILQCLSDYDQEATQKRQEEIHLAKKNAVFRKIYEQFVKDNPIELKENIWQNISCQTEFQTTTTNFFELYQEEFGG